MSKPLTYRVIYDSEIEQVNWCGLTVPATQVIIGFDTLARIRSGLIVTTTVEKDFRAVGNGSGRLYIRASTPDYGQWETAMPDAQLKFNVPRAVWFHCKEAPGLTILKAPQTSLRR